MRSDKWNKISKSLMEYFFQSMHVPHPRSTVYSPGSRPCGEPEISISVCGIFLIRLVEKGWEWVFCHTVWRDAHHTALSVSVMGDSLRDPILSLKKVVKCTWMKSPWLRPMNICTSQRTEILHCLPMLLLAMISFVEIMCKITWLKTQFSW